MEYDASDTLVLRPNHTFLHYYKEDGQVFIEQGDWALFNKTETLGFDAKSLSILTKAAWDPASDKDPSNALLSKPADPMMGWHNRIGNRECIVVAYSDEVLIQGGPENGNWYRSVHKPKP